MTPTIGDLRLMSGMEVTLESGQADTFNQFFQQCLHIHTEDNGPNINFSKTLGKKQHLDLGN